MARPIDGTTPQGSWGDWLAPQDAWDRVLARWPLSSCPTEMVPLLEGPSRTLAEDIQSPLDLPQFDRSTVDGYAVHVSHLVGASARPVRLRAAPEVVMGERSTTPLEPGTAAWIATGAMIPPGANGVVMVEQTRPDEGAILMEEEIVVGANIIRRASDLRAGESILRAGTRLDPRHVAVLASLGLDTVPVRRRPRVAIISGGDELSAPGAPLPEGHVYDANSSALAAQVASWGGEPTVFPRVLDQEEETLAALQKALKEAEIVLISGGSSIGKKDLTARVIERAGKPGILVHGIAMRPGRPTLLGLIGESLIVGIPGNPVSAMIACEVFARPAIGALLGLRALPAGIVGRYGVRGRLAEGVDSLLGRQDYLRVRISQEADGRLVHQVPGGSGNIRSMVEADGLLVVPPEENNLEAGDEVEVRLF